MAADPYKYFRIEARDLLEGLHQGVLSLEKGLVTPDLVRGLLRMAHTLKGAARVVKQAPIADLAHALEDLLAQAAPPERVRQALDRIGESLHAIAPAEPKARAEEPIESVRVDIEETERLLESVFETRLHLSSVQAEVDAIGSPRVRAAVERTERELEQVRESADRLRLVPVATVFGALERTARDLAAGARKRVGFRASGGESRVDGHVLASIRDALVQIVRNAVAHGIEAPAQRVRSGKPEEGRVELRVERRGARVAFVLGDDGQGIDAEAVRRVTASPSPLTTEQAIEILLKGGVTTRATPTEEAGRGVGLDVVRETVGRLRGEVAIRTERGRGTTVEMVVPVSLSSVPALAIEAGGVVAAIPLSAVRLARRLPREEISVTNEGLTLLLEGRAIPFQYLATLLGGAPRSAAGGTAVIVRSGTGEAAIGVDRVLGTGTEVVRPLPAWAGVDGIVAGASLDAHGVPRPLLDPEALVSAARRSRERPAEVEEAPPRAILVIDDSLTTRMLEQGILESAGYAVDLATSGEEALSKARAREYGLFIVDVEMPGMDGFEFLARAKEDATLRSVPAILVTSRSAPEDRRRGEELGARAYVVKSDFDQKRLLSTIRGLL